MIGLALDGTAVGTTVERAIAGDEVAFARIVGAYHLDLVRVAFVVCGDEGLAEDAAQASWWIAWRKLGSLRDPDRLKPWLVAIAANEAHVAAGGLEVGCASRLRHRGYGLPRPSETATATSGCQR